jgi:AraC family transcriptional regulator, transcriptional activator FtrA
MKKSPGRRRNRRRMLDRSSLEEPIHDMRTNPFRVDRACEALIIFQPEVPRAAYRSGVCGVIEDGFQRQECQYMIKSCQMRRPRLVTALVYEGLCTFEFGLVVEAFALPRPELGIPWYRFQVCSLEPGPVLALGGVRVQARSGLAGLRAAHTIVIPGWRNIDEPPPAKLSAALRRAHAGGARIVSVCSGVFVLAAAGLLDGKRATTHWRYTARLAARFPRIHVVPDVLYVDEGQVMTSAGSAAGLDLCLHIIRKDFGAEIANRVAKRLVVPPHRDGGQAQYVADVVKPDSSRLASLLAWAQGNLHRDLTLGELARHAGMSERSFARHFRAETGTTAHQWLVHQRLIAAQRRLEMTRDSVDRIAEAVGLGTAATLRHHFRRRLQTSPARYRRRFTTLAQSGRKRRRPGSRA